MNRKDEPGKPNYKATAAMLRDERDADRAYENQDLRLLSRAKNNLEAYEALEKLEAGAQRLTQRYRSIKTGIAYRVLEDGKR